MSQSFDIWTILRGIGVIVVMGGLIAGLAFVENSQRQRLFARMTKGLPRGWVRPARDRAGGGLALYRVDAPKWTVVIPLALIAVVVIWRVMPLGRFETLDSLVLAGLVTWVCLILFRPDVVLSVNGHTLREHRVLGRDRLHDLGLLTGIAPRGDDFAYGYILTFETGRRVIVPFDLGGVYQLAQHLQSFHNAAYDITTRVDAYLEEGA